MIFSRQPGSVGLTTADFNSVAGREDHGLAQAGGRADGLEGQGDSRRRKSQLFPDFDRSGLMVQSQSYNMHI